MVHHGRDLRVRVDVDKAGGKLVALADIDQPGVIFGTAVTGCEQLFQQDCHFHTIWRAERIKLDRMLADGQFLVMRWSGNRPVDIGKGTAIALFPGPDLWRDIACGEVQFGRELVFVVRHVWFFRSSSSGSPRGYGGFSCCWQVAFVLNLAQVLTARAGMAKFRNTVPSRMHFPQPLSSTPRAGNRVPPHTAEVGDHAGDCDRNP